jgi:hypothetical protein
MTAFTITYRDETGRAAETVEADVAELDPAGVWLVLRRVVLVVGRPREVVVRRLAAGDVAEVSARDGVE